MADEPCSRSMDVDRHELDIRDLRSALRSDYVRKDVYQAALDRLAALEAKLSTTWLSNRNALLAVASFVVGIVVSAYLASGGGK